VATIYYDQDASLDPLRGKSVAVIGYGSQGHAHALNLRDSGVNVVVGLHESSKSRDKAAADGLRVETVADAAKAADIVMVLVPDQTQKKVFNESIMANLQSGNMLMFAHGFSIHFGEVVPPDGVDVTMIAPKSPGHRLRELFSEGVGIDAGWCYRDDVQGRVRDRSLR
jgi:ketol-acid reductoisomerase